MNLLGIYNALRLSKLVTSGSIGWDAATGELVLTDQISADKLDIQISNLQVKDTDKLRQLLSEHFLVTATYRAVPNIVSGPDVSGLQSYFHIEQNPTRTRMRDYLYIPVALGLLDEQTASSSLGNLGDYGKTTVYAEARYNNADFRSLFFDGGSLVSPDVYASAGRKAIQSLVIKGDDDDLRLILATNDGLFKQLQDIGNVQSSEFIDACVQAGIRKDLVPAVAVDFINVVWLQEAMQTAGRSLSDLDKFLSANPNVDPNNHDFLNLKRQLVKSLAGVVQRATADFGGPWGFEAMVWLGKYSSKKWLITNRHITRELHSN